MILNPPTNSAFERSEMSPDPVILFIHGTWSTPRTWDFFETTLRQIFPSLTFIKARWSGRNSANERRRAAHELINELKPYREKPLIVICHSHGANVFLEAASRIPNRLEMIICLNSPLLTVHKYPMPTLIWVGIFMVSLLALAIGIGSVAGISHSDNGVLPIASAIVVIASLLIAKSRYASLLLVLVAMAAVSALYLWLTNLRPFIFDSSTGAPLPTAMVYWPIPTVLYEALLCIVPSFFILVVVLTIYGLISSRSLRLAPTGTVPFRARLIHILAIDDEIFAVLGIAIALQRVIQLVVSPVYMLLHILKIPGVAMILLVAGLAGDWLMSHLLKHNLYQLVTILESWALLPILVAAFLLVMKTFLFGVAYGWEYGGLSVDHGIYISPGVLAGNTELHVIFPEDANRLSLSHPKIHQRQSVLDEIIDLLQAAGCVPSCADPSMPHRNSLDQP